MERMILAVAVASLAMPALANEYNNSYNNKNDKPSYNTRSEKLNNAQVEAYFMKLDKDNNGVLSVSEQKPLGEKVSRMDRNRDDQISKFELERDYDVSMNNHAWGYDNMAPGNQHPTRNTAN